MSDFDIKNFNFDNIPEDEESIEILKQIQLLKNENLTNNIDFEKAEQERLELEEKNKQRAEKNANKEDEKENKSGYNLISKEIDEEENLIL